MQQGREELYAILRRAGLISIGDAPDLRPLTGGVSSDIWHVAIEDRAYCIKRALSKLKVRADWQVTTRRSYYEAGWMQTANILAPGMTPEVIHFDTASTAIVMTYLDPGDHRLWKGELLAGRVDTAFSGAVGDALARIHAGTAGVERVRSFFATDRIFREIRIDPYLTATAKIHPTLAAKIRAVARVTMINKHTLVHGDVSPKNILMGRDGPVFLDAECAWYGDPAFDLAFCLNHLLLKSAYKLDAATDLMTCFGELREKYFAGVDWEKPGELEQRTARLLPCLLLARIDGKSPVEYLTDEASKDKIRNFANRFIATPTPLLDNIAKAWIEDLKN